MALFKRILEVDGIFIPQQWNFFNGWYGHSRHTKGITWLALEAQIKYCSYDSLEEARSAFESKKQIIHKV